MWVFPTNRLNITYTASTWNQINLGPSGLNLVPAGTKAVVIMGRSGSGNYNYAVSMDNSLEYTGGTFVCGTNITVYRVVPLRENETFSLWCDNTIVAWGVQAYSLAPRFRPTPGLIQFAQDLAASTNYAPFGWHLAMGQYPILFGTIAGGGTAGAFAMRPKGSSANLAENIYAGSANFFATGVDSLSMMELRKGHSGQRHWYEGFENGVWLDTPVNISPGTTGSWQTIDISAHVPTNCNGVICELINTTASTYFCAIRPPSSTDLGQKVRATTKLQAMCGSSSQQIQGFLENAGCQIRLLGYFVNEEVIYPGPAALNFMAMGEEFIFEVKARSEQGKKFFMEMEVC